MVEPGSEVTTLATLLGADASMIQRDDILNLVVVEKETLLKSQSSRLQKDIKDVRKAVGQKLEEIGEALVTLVESSTPDLKGYQSAIAKLWPKRKLMWQVKLDGKSFIPNFTSKDERAWKNDAIGALVLSELDQPKPEIGLKVVIPDEDKNSHRSVTATEWTKEIKFSSGIKKLVDEHKALSQEVSDKSSEFINLQRQIQDLPQLERAAKAGMTKQILEQTADGRKLLSDVRSSDEVQRVLKIQS